MIYINKFDFKYRRHIIKLIKYANSMFKFKSWTINIVVWQDGDYNITLKSGVGNDTRYEFTYKKSCNKYMYRIIKMAEEFVSVEEELK